MELEKTIAQGQLPICCARPSGRARIGTPPAPTGPAPRVRCARPSGRARIGTRFRRFDGSCWQALRPAFGSGEDWNRTVSELSLAPHPVAPGLRVGRGLERVCRGETNRSKDVAPGLRVGRGLELRLRVGLDGRNYVAPGLRVGRGLEPRPLEITPSLMALRPAFGSGEDWNIEPLPLLINTRIVAPGLRVGRGLELKSRSPSTQIISHVAPGLRVGRGLEQLQGSHTAAHNTVAPGLRVGRGLEQRVDLPRQRQVPGCARPSGRARIGTRTSPRHRACGR